MTTYICRISHAAWALCLAWAFTTNLSAQELRWRPHQFVTDSGTSVEGAEWGTLRVPEDHGHPDGRQLELAMVRLPATAPQPGPPIVYLAGGPGGSGIELARGGRWPLFDTLRAFGDVIALDPRGAGHSRPSLDSSLRLDYPLDRPLERETYTRMLAAKVAEAAEQFRAQGFDLAQYRTPALADDLELLRIALGADQLRLVGMSYGSHLGLEMLRRHPDSVERIVLAGVEGPDQCLKLPGQLDAGLEHVSRLLAEDPATRRVVPDLIGSARDLIARLRAEPVTVPTPVAGSTEPVPVVLGPLDLQLFFASLAGRRDTVPHLPRLLAGMEQGDWSFLASVSANLRRQPIELMGLLVDCASYGSDARLERIARERETSLLGDALDFPLHALR